MHRAFARLLIALTLPTAIGAATAHASETTTLDCWSGFFDLDGDGYARADARSNQRMRIVLDGEHYTCPAPWVGVRGDCDDDDPAVHPRQFETRGNNVDDDCDGQIDEPETWAAPAGHGVERDGFEVFVRIADDAVPAVFEDGALYARVETQALTDTAASRFGSYQRIQWLHDLPEFAYTAVSISGLASATVYRARVRFYRRVVSGGRAIYWPVGVASDWHRQMTDGDGLDGARADMVNAGLYEAWLDGKQGRVGYYAADENGTRYGADLDEAWCSEFYSAVLTPFVDGLGHRSSVARIIDWYADYGRDIEVPADRAEDWMSIFARPGDYLALDTNSESGGPGRSPDRGSHRSGRAELPHPAPRVTGLLRYA